MEINNLGDTLFQVCLEEDGIKHCCVVDLRHKTGNIEQNLRAAIRRKALNSFIESKAQQ